MIRMTQMHALILGLVTSTALLGCQNDESGSQAKIIAAQNQSAIEELQDQLRALRSSARKDGANTPHSGFTRESGSDQGSQDRESALLDEIEMLNDKLSAQAEVIKGLEARIDENEATLKARASVHGAGPSGSGTTSSPFRPSFGDGTVPSHVTDMIRNRLEERAKALGEDISEFPDDFAGLLQLRQELNVKERNKEMGIDEATAERLTDIETSYKNKTSELVGLLSSGTISQDQYDLEHKAAKDSANNQLDALLTPDQKSIYDKEGGLSGRTRNTFILETDTDVGVFEPAD